jgi:flagellar protein FliL
MSEQESTTEAPKGKRSKLPLLLGVAMAALLGGGGFFAAYSGMLPTGGNAHPHPAVTEGAGMAFVPLTPIVVTLGGEQRLRQLRFAAFLEVQAGQEQEVLRLMPRTLDVLNGYLRAVSLSDIEAPSALVKLRAQMLRRVQIVVGEAVVRDLLITEFVLN